MAVRLLPLAEKVCSEDGPFPATYVKADSEAGVRVIAGLVEGLKVRLKSSMALWGLLPAPDEAVFAAIRIQTGPVLLSRAEPKLTVTFVLPQEEPTVVVIEAGAVVEFVKEAGEAPKP